MNIDENGFPTETQIMHWNEHNDHADDYDDGDDTLKHEPEYPIELLADDTMNAAIVGDPMPMSEYNRLFDEMEASKDPAGGTLSMYLIDNIIDRFFTRLAILGMMLGELADNARADDDNPDYSRIKTLLRRLDRGQLGELSLACNEIRKLCAQVDKETQ